MSYLLIRTELNGLKMEPLESTPYMPFETEPVDIAHCSELVEGNIAAPLEEHREEAAAYVFGARVTTVKDPLPPSVQNVREAVSPAPDSLSGRLSRHSIVSNESVSTAGTQFSAEVNPCLADLENLAYHDRRSSTGSSVVDFNFNRGDKLSAPTPEDLPETSDLKLFIPPKKIKSATKLDLSLANLRKLMGQCLHDLPLENSTLDNIKTLDHKGNGDTPFSTTSIDIVTLADSDYPRLVRRRREITQPHLKWAFDEFQREQKIHASLKHPNIVQFFGCDIVEQGGKIFMDTYTAYAGENASSVLTNDADISPERFINYACQLFSTLVYLESCKVFHRDITPANLLIDGDKINLIDFEFAHSNENPNQTISQYIQGVPLYIAPELGPGCEATSSSETYSASMTLIRLMAQMGLVDRRRLRHELNDEGKWGTPQIEMLEPAKHIKQSDLQMFREVLDTLNLGIIDNPDKRPSALEMEQRLNQILTTASGTDNSPVTPCDSDLPTPVSVFETNPFFTPQPPCS